MSEFKLPADFQPFRTEDGSYTLRSAGMDEQYHSRHGAVQESQHVFIQNGMLTMTKGNIDVLEIGLGTGLNALLTWLEADRHGLQVNYFALEPHPLPAEAIAALGHPAHLGHPELDELFARMMGSPETWTSPSGRFSFHCAMTPVQEFQGRQRFDLVYFDAFAPEKQPEMWTQEIFHRLHEALRPGGILVTYCAKGVVRRAMQAAGFVVERLSGPPGKREMLRARRPLSS